MIYLVAMSNVRRPDIPNPMIPEIKKPSISKAIRLGRKISSLSVKKMAKRNNANKSTLKKKTTAKGNIGTCYFQLDVMEFLRKECQRYNVKS